MCLYSNTNIPKIADSDIICYKILIKSEDEYYSPLMSSFSYCLNSLNKPTDEFNYLENKIDYRFGLFFLIDIGYLHCLTINGLNEYTIKDALQCDYKYPLSLCSSAYIARCYIPKGAKYYVGQDNDICSNLLFVTDDIVSIKDFMYHIDNFDKFKNELI